MKTVTEAKKPDWKERNRELISTPEKTVAVFLILVLCIPFSIMGVLTWLLLGSPVIFAQERTGKAGRVFTIRKFRTMRDIRDREGRLLPDRARETPLTRLVRRLRLDEMPQLFSIARGDMAFVGPRPLLPATIADFGERGVWRCKVRPGLAGWSQVSGNTFLTDEEKLCLDLWYIEHRSLALDLKIMLEVVFTILFGERRREERISASRAFVAMRMKAGGEKGRKQEGGQS